jgi:ATP-dependent Clp protease ATP-binding subunit ClpB
VDFRNTIIVMTSNIGSDVILNMAAKGAMDLEIEAHVRELLKQALRPELINRIDETITFHQLTKRDLAGIVQIQLRQLRTRLADRGLSLDVSEAAMNELAEAGYDPQFGARPLKRIIQQRLENPIAARILAGEVDAGDTIVVNYEGKSFTFARQAAPEAVQA